MPFFYLDAHWQHYWPLRTELKHISDAGVRCAIVIDDFEVPGQPQFGFDIDGGGEVIAGLACNLDYVRASLGPQNRYKVLFPKYGSDDAFGAGTIGAVKIGSPSTASSTVVTGSVIAAGLRPGADGQPRGGNDSIFGATSAERLLNTIASLTILGQADPNSYFAAGKFKAAPVIGGTRITDLANDTRFFVA